MVNDRGTEQISDELYQAALSKAVVSGDVVLRRLVEKECTLPGEWEYVEPFRDTETQPPPKDPQIFRALKHRLLVTESNDVVTFRVPLMRRWLAEKIQ